MRRLAKDNRGFTLIEMMMVVALLGIFLGIVYSFLSNNMRFLARRDNEHEAYLQARIAMYRVTSMLRQYEKLAVDDYDKVVRGDGVNLINFNNNESNPGDNSYYYFYWDATAETGQLRETSGNKPVARGIKDIKFKTIILPSSNNDMIKVVIQAIPQGAPSDSGLTLSTELRADRHYVP